MRLTERKQDIKVTTVDIDEAQVICNLIYAYAKKLGGDTFTFECNKSGTDRLWLAETIRNWDRPIRKLTKEERENYTALRRLLDFFKEK